MRRRRLCVHRLAFQREASGLPLIRHCIPPAFLLRIPVTFTQHTGAAACASPFGEVLGTALGVAGTPSVKIFYCEL
jgi:hypothetical protein